ncbi:MAG: type IX secretion system membrane protein PorP/SprF [Bacteroidales bacterium]|jgi:type IX secretion system PorP/SprF family membrane protein|nr:type IX secretion system membrane protein PorP/SprF [Bacteroidales bacterium]
MRLVLKIILLLQALFIVTFVSAQQEPQFTHNMFNHMGINPGYAGLNNAICATGLARQQWVGFKDAEGNRVTPETYLISVDGTVRALRGGIGGSVMQDKIGFYTINDIQLGYSYHRQIREAKLGIGLQLNFINSILDAGKFLPVDETDPLLQNLQGEASNMMFDLNLGMFYQVPEKYYLGFASTRLLESSKEYDNSSGAYNNFRRHYYLTGGFQFKLGRNPAYEFIPSVFIKSDGASIQTDFNTLVVYNKKVYGGITYRHQDAISLMVGFTTKDMQIGYSYDVPISVVGGYGSHEVMLSYCFKLEVEKFKNSYRNTRYL